MKRFIAVLGVLALLLLAACSSSGLPDYSSPEKTIETLKWAADKQDARRMYETFSVDFREEFGITYELFKANLDLNPAEYDRLSKVSIDQIFDQGDVQIIVLEDGDRVFLINERGYWKIRMIQPPAQQ